MSTLINRSPAPLRCHWKAPAPAPAEPPPSSPAAPSPPRDPPPQLYSLGPPALREQPSAASEEQIKRAPSICACQCGPTGKAPRTIDNRRLLLAVFHVTACVRVSGTPPPPLSMQLQAKALLAGAAPMPASSPSSSARGGFARGSSPCVFTGESRGFKKNK